MKVACAFSPTEETLRTAQDSIYWRDYHFFPLSFLFRLLPQGTAEPDHVDFATHSLYIRAERPETTDPQDVDSFDLNYRSKI
jgi:hypothetical protein